MYHTILVPLDGSELAERALPYAQILGKASGARLLLLRAVPTPAVTIGGPSPEQIQALHEAETYLAEVAARVAPALVVETAAFQGDPAASIFEEIRLRQVDLVVMSTHGRSGLGRWVYGSVADQIMREAQIPVLLIPSTLRATWPSDRQPRLLVPLDGSAFSREAIEPAAKLARALRADMVLLEVVVPLTQTYADASAYVVYDPKTELENAHSYLDKVAIDLRAQGLTVTAFDAIGPAVTMISAATARESVDLIALSTHGSGGVTRLLMGSVASGLVQQAKVPILIVRPESVRQSVEVGSGSEGDTVTSDR